jgi:RNA polymerase sigma factor (sigma-70 family)
MTPDCELLRRYAGTKSEEAFAELVQRHVNLVYTAALRQVNGDAHLAQDVAQVVFTDLARKAAPLSRRATLTSWLYTSAHFAAAKTVRTENRRRDREEKCMREPISETAPELDWEKLRPSLDDAMDELKEADREAILLRYFENRPFAEIGGKLGLNENTARMRVERALEKLRAVFLRRGVAATTALASVISANAVQIAPAGLAATLTSTSLAGAGTGTTFTLLKLMATTKLQTGIVCGIVVASAVASLLIEHQAQAKMRQLDVSQQRQQGQLAQTQAENERLSNFLAQANRPNHPGDLEKLRDEVTMLRSQTNALKALQDEERRLQAALAKAREDLVGPKEDDFEWSETLGAKQKYIIELSNAIREYARNHQDRFPTSFDEAATYLSAQARSDTNFTPDQFEIVYQGSMSNAFNNTYAHPKRILLLRERQPWKNTDGKWVKLYEAIPGQKWNVSLPYNDFEAWEEQRIAPPESSDQ